MRLTINGDLNPYYIQTLCMLFYPGAKFGEQDGDDDNAAVFTRTDSGDQITVECEFSSGGKSASASAAQTVGGESVWLGSDPDADPRERASKLAAGNAALAAGKELFASVPSWGVLTGIRPAKLASTLLTATDADGVRLHKPTEAKSILINSFGVNPRKAALAIEIAKNEQKIARLSRIGKAPTCSIYVSIPFCPSRCAYCSFVSYTTKKLLDRIPEYIERLILDLAATLEYLKARGFRVMTVYIGGGTPTTLSADQLERLLAVISGRLDTQKLTEFTLEGGRPDTITAEKLEVARALGVSRISINPQTMNDPILKGIGRRHSVDDFYRAYTMAKNSGIKVINTDLIAGLPGDDFEGFSRSLDRIIALDPENITVHTFCVKKSADILKSDTEIYDRSADETVKGVDYSQVRLKNVGYTPYYIYRQKNTIGNLENVGYAKKGCEGFYNVLMMEELHPIFAVGAGAVTKLVRIDEVGKKHIERIFEPKYPFEYLSDKRAPISQKLEKCDAFFGFDS